MADKTAPERKVYTEKHEQRKLTQNFKIFRVDTHLTNNNNNSNNKTSEIPQSGI